MSERAASTFVTASLVFDTTPERELIESWLASTMVLFRSASTGWRIYSGTVGSEAHVGFSKARLDDHIRRLLEGSTGEVSVADALGKDFEDPFQGVTVGVIAMPSYVGEAGWPTVIGASVPTNIALTDPAFWVDLLTTHCDADVDATGWVTVDQSNNWIASPMDVATRLGPFATLKDHKRYLRGCHWADLLTPHHIDLVGGRHRLEEVSAAIQELSHGRLLSIATPTLGVLDDATLDARARVFAPAFNPRYSGRPVKRRLRVRPLD